jgi:3-hydroxybutyrate dehydrogenase
MSLAGRIAIVTGSTSGIGFGVAEALASEGASIMLNGFGDAGEIEAMRAGLSEKHGVPVRYNAADMARPAEIAALVEAASIELGGADILVNNAGIQHTALIEDFPEDKWDAIIAINLSAAFHAMRAAIPGMRRTGWGRIVNVASAHGLVASAQKSAYVAAKHGLVGLTKAAAIELANAGVTCNAICPGWVLTPLVEKQIASRAGREGRSEADVRHDLLAEKQPMLEFTTPAMVGSLAVYLCSDAARTVTGAALSMDGGWTAG